MRRIVGTVFQSLDGVMQAPGGEREDPTGGFAHGGWQMGIEDPVAGAANEAMLTPPYALLLGRRTYDIFASYWPFVEGEMAELGQAFTAAEKFVLTHGDQPLEWENSHRLASVDELAEVKDGDGPDLRIWGSGGIYPALIARGLLDSLTLMTYPVVLGGGKRTFRTGTPAGLLRMTDHRVGPQGVVIATYVPDGEIPDAPPNLPSPNAREDRRQAEIAEGAW